MNEQSLRDAQPFERDKSLKGVKNGGRKRKVKEEING